MISLEGGKKWGNKLICLLIKATTSTSDTCGIVWFIRVCGKTNLPNPLVATDKLPDPLFFISPIVPQQGQYDTGREVMFS